ncbi:hypothetical protein BACEGG_00602 [Bacteroides eggerthii DSM 20697]|nr:hypothetical protein BACEGG_00602 [Bacteroides eggerthii DSM 20697]
MILIIIWIGKYTGYIMRRIKDFQSGLPETSFLFLLYNENSFVLPEW